MSLKLFKTEGRAHARATFINEMNLSNNFKVHVTKDDVSYTYKFVTF